MKMVNKRGIRSCKRAQEVIGMSFGTIFSILLIVFFIIVAIIAIKMFIGGTCSMTDNAQEGLFIDDLKNAVKNVWNSAGGESPFKIKLPTKIKYVCFFDENAEKKGKYSDFTKDFRIIGGNVYLYPSKQTCSDFRRNTVPHINMSATTATENPVCFENGKELVIESKGGPVIIRKK